MKKLTTLALAAVLGLTSATANAEFFEPTNWTAKFGFVLSSYNHKVDNVDPAVVKKGDKKDVTKAKLKPTIAFEADYGVLGSAVVYAGLSYANLGKLNVKTTTPPAASDAPAEVAGKADTPTAEPTVTELTTKANLFALYTGLRKGLYYGENGTLYGTAALGVGYLTFNSSNSAVEKVNSPSIYAQLGLGYTVDQFSVELNFVPAFSVADKKKKFAFDTNVISLSVGYTF